MIKRYGIIILLAFGLILLSSCTRKNVDDPDMTGGAGFRIQISGTASPSTLYVPENLPSVHSNITARVLKNDGSPAVNYKVIFQTDALGYFEDYQLSDTKTTDGGGNARIKFYIPPGTRAIGDTRVELKATVVDDGRNDIPFLSEIYDYIPIRVIPYDAKEMVVIKGHVYACSGVQGLPGVVLTFSGGAGIAISRSSGSYDAFVPWGWTGEITAEAEGFTFVPDSITISTPLYKDIAGQDFFGTASDYGLVATPATYDVGAAGASNLEIWVGSVDNICSISYRISSGADWITIVSGEETGVTENTFHFDVSANGSGSSRSGEISVMSTTPGVISEVIIKVDQEG